jgi:hypothetical protein
MTVKEFLYEFNISWNNIMSNQAPGLSPYEISIFLTQAQESIVKGIYNGSLTSSFESTEEARSYLSPLVIQGYPEKIQHQADYPHITKGTILYDLNDIKDIKGGNLPNIWFMTYEGVIFDKSGRCSEGIEGIVKPITQDTFWDIHRNPFRKENERRVLRLTFQSGEDNIAELVSEYPIEKYFIRYMRKPKPIILKDLTRFNATIDGETNEQTCELNENLHRVILDMAVKLAQQAWVMTRTQTRE